MSEFRVWAPTAARVQVTIGTAVRAMNRVAGGWWVTSDPAAGPGTDYAFLLDADETPLPDPRAAWQPAGVHAPSRLYDHAAFDWTDGSWTGRTLAGAVLYELHIGTFTPEGTFDAAVAKLDHLVDLGVDLVELLPVNSFNGPHGWGYDGVCWYAPHEPYGGPDGLKRFVDAAHGKGLGVVLDAVYNHFGPSGAYAPRFGPYLSDGANSWGASMNLDGPDCGEVRRYIIDSAVQWLRDYHIDALRLDAVHALVDRGATHLLTELAVEVESLATHLGRPLTLIAESDQNDPRTVTPRAANGLALDAQWDDDVHHALHALLTGERQGYYDDFGSLECLAAVLKAAFWHAGTWSTFRRRVHGRAVDRTVVPGYRFVAFLQNHDQIGNRAAGDRLTATLSPGLLRVGATLLFTSPFTPMLFMGEEWHARTPWQFFTSHPEPDLARAVVEGRRREFAEHGWPEGDVPDPQDPATFAASKLDWSTVDPDALDFHRRLIAVRRAVPDLADPRLDRVHVFHGHGFVVVRRGGHRVVANLADHPQRIALRATPREVVFATAPGVILSPDSVELPAQSAAVIQAD